MSGYFFSDRHSVARILVMAPLLFALLIVPLHALGKHTLAKTNAYGLVVTVALGSAISSAILTKRVALLDGVLAIGLLLGLESLLAFVASHVPRTRRWLTQRPTLRLRDGRMEPGALRRERVTEAEVLAAVRKHGHASVEGVGAVVLEVDGSFSVIPELDDSRSALADVERVPVDR